MDPLHITEFASERYFSKLKQLNEPSNDAASSPPSSSSASAEAPSQGAAAATSPSLHTGNTFSLPLGRQRSLDDGLPPLTLKPSEQKKRSLGHDLTALRTQRRPSFTGSFGRLSSRVNIIHKVPSILEHREETLAQDPTAPQTFNLSNFFLALPNELQAHIIAPLPIHTVLMLRLVSKSFHTIVTLNEPTIARYHIVNTLPAYALRLYPAPDPASINLHYLCSLWHRLHVAEKLSTMIAAQATKEIFLRNTDALRLEFEPQHRRMRQRLMPLVFTLFHFFETYREIHIHRLNNGPPLRHQAYTVNPIEAQVMSMYDDETLLKVHQVFPLVVSSFSRRLRPPSYVGTLERSIKGYLKDRPPDEVYATILAVGGLRQAQRFWETKGYNARRAAVDIWYGFITWASVEPAPTKSKKSLISHLGRKKYSKVPESSSSTPLSDTASHDAMSCREWFCVKPTCSAPSSHRRPHSTDNLVFHSSLAAGPPMPPLPRDQLRLILPDLQHLSNIWMHTAEAMILGRGIVGRPQDIKRNTQVLLDLIHDDGSEMREEFVVAPEVRAQRAMLILD
ncbi:uncharacterized protein L3040_002960 [Drepanopeziza brunnea f. sp. 'multigermtubi']|nr:hypothetical protein L3040_002960 [Drepanopeziza brunnea f. sp. 'multigermtubi']